MALLAARDGWVFESFEAALAELGEDHDEEMTIRVARGTALPAELVDPEHDVPRLPGSYSCGDVAIDLDDVWLVDPDDASIGAEARYIQAQAMAAGLNAADQEASSTGPQETGGEPA